MYLADRDPSETPPSRLIVGPARWFIDRRKDLEEGETPDDIIHHFDISSHPLGQKIEAKSTYPSLALLGISAFFSMWVWGQYPGYELWSARAADVYGKGEYWRLLTTLFVHADTAHLLANAGLFFVFGTLLRQYFSSWAFPVLSLLGGVLTSAISLLTYDPEVRLIGASGMVYLMAALWLLLFWKYADYLSWIQRSMRTLAFVLVVLAPSTIEPQVSYRTHAIGLFLGIFLGWLSGPWLKPLPVPAQEETQSSAL